MVSGWDKNPGPDNHYSSGPVSISGAVKALVWPVLVVIVGVIVYRYLG